MSENNLLRVKVAGPNFYEVDVGLNDAIDAFDVKKSLYDHPFSNEDLMKMVSFFATNETVIKNRPYSLNIKSVESIQPSKIFIGVNFIVVRNMAVETQKFHQDFIENFSEYFNDWCNKFVMFYGKYLEAASADQLKEFMAHK